MRYAKIYGTSIYDLYRWLHIVHSQFDSVYLLAIDILVIYT